MNGMMSCCMLRLQIQSEQQQHCFCEVWPILLNTCLGNFVWWNFFLMQNHHAGLSSWELKARLRNPSLKSVWQSGSSNLFDNAELWTSLRISKAVGHRSGGRCVLNLPFRHDRHVQQPCETFKDLTTAQHAVVNLDMLLLVSNSQEYITRSHTVRLNWLRATFPPLNTTYRMINRTDSAL